MCLERGTVRGPCVWEACGKLALVRTTGTASHVLAACNFAITSYPADGHTADHCAGVIVASR
jgi:hypothetical protein